MIREKLISVILPVYNGQSFLEESISSILSQTHRNLELIIVNDCSTDNSSLIIDKYVQSDKRVHVIKNETNKKLPASLNIGFSCAKGEYLTWTSDDNVYEQDALKEMHNFLESNTDEYGLVYTDMMYMDESGQIYGRNSSTPKDLFLYNCIGACFLYRNICRLEIGEYDVSRFLVEDYDYWLRISMKYKIGHIERCLYKYRNHKNSLTSTQSKKINQQVLNLKLDNLKYILSNVSNLEKRILLFELCAYGYEVDSYLMQEILGVRDNSKDLEWIIRPREFDKNKKIILFGSGSIGRSALDFFEEELIYAFVDNDIQKVGKFISGKKIISVNELKDVYMNYNVVITTDLRKSYYIAEQLENLNIKNYSLFCEML